MAQPFKQPPIGKTYYTYPSDTGTQKSALPLISVIVPIYNAEPYLDQALASIEEQSYDNLEIICLNDGSTDNSLKTIRRHAEADDRIVVIDKQNEGYGATCNRGIDEAHGTWISILEPDDWLEQGMYADMMEHASRFPGDADIIKSPYWRIENADTPQQRKLHCSYARKMKRVKQPFKIEDAPCLIRHHPSIWSAIYRREFLNANKIRFRPIPGAGWADNPFLVDTLCRAERILYLDRAYYCYRADNDDQERAFHKANPSIPINRWMEMTDTLEELAVSDTGVLKAHHERGFMYIGGVLESYSPDDPKVHDMVSDVFERMNPDIVFQDDGISPAAKRLFSEFRGMAPSSGGRVRHAGYLAGQAAYNVLNVGPKELAQSVKRYVTKYGKRSGGR